MAYAVFVGINQPTTSARSGLATTSTDGWVLENPTNATAGATVQISPRNRLRGTGWDTDNAVSRTVDFFTENLPATGNTVTGTWKLGYSLDGAAASYPVTVSSAGKVTTLENVEIPAAMSFLIVDRLYMSSAAAGNLYLRNPDGTNRVDITLADWGTTLSGEAVTVANNGVLFLGAAPQGTLFVNVGTDNSAGIFTLRGAGNTTAEVADAGATMSVTKDAATSINIYYDATGGSGAGYYLQNKRGGDRAVRLVLIGA